MTSDEHFAMQQQPQTIKRRDLEHAAQQLGYESLEAWVAKKSETQNPVDPTVEADPCIS